MVDRDDADQNIPSFSHPGPSSGKGQARWAKWPEKVQLTPSQAAVSAIAALAIITVSYLMYLNVTDGGKNYWTRSMIPLVLPVAPETGAQRSVPAASVVLSYYAAINARNYREAWTLGGSSFSDTYEEFVERYSTTEKVVASVERVVGTRVEASLRSTGTTGTVIRYRAIYWVADGRIESVSLRKR